MILQAAQIIAAFNLVCSGTYTSGEFLKPRETREVVLVLRVDLERGRWCSGVCETTAPIDAVTDTMIVFRRDGNLFDAARDDVSDKITFVNRESGEYLDRERLLIGSVMHITMTRGTCERADFSGFPEPLF